MTKEELESKENDLILLPDLYIRKLRIVEKLHNLRSNFFPKENRLISNRNFKDERPFAQWDYVLQEVKWMAHEFKEERKYKQALAYHCSRRIMKQTKQENIYNQELVLYHKLLSHELAEMVRNEFSNVYKEVKEPSIKELEQEKNSMEIELSSVQYDLDVLDMDLELKQKASGINPNNPPINTNNAQANPILNNTPVLKKQAISLPISTMSVQSSKIRKKGNINNQKISNQPIPVIKMQPLLVEYMRKMIEVGGLQTSENCNLIDTNQTYENLVKLFKRFPKKTKHLKSNAPDMFNTPSGALGGPIITPFEENIKNMSHFGSSNNLIENSGQKKRKKASFREDGNKTGGGISKLNEFRKGSDYLNFKKIKNPENFDEILTMFYNDNKIGEGDYQKIFSSSLEQNGNNFPKTWDDVPTIKFHEILFEKEFKYCEKVFDEEFEKNNQENLIMLEDFMNGLRDKMERYYLNRTQLINCDDSTLSRYLEKDQISFTELINSFPKIHKHFLITYSKEGGIHGHKGKFKLFKEIYPSSPQTSNEIISLETHLNRKWPMIALFLLDYYFNIYGNKWNLVTDALNNHIITKNYLLTYEVCENKWLSFMSKKNALKFVDLQNKLFPKKSLNYNDNDDQGNTMEIKEENMISKRNKIFSSYSKTRQKNNKFSINFEKFKQMNQKFEKKETYLPIYPSEQSKSLYENIVNDFNSNKEKQKEICEIFDLPSKKQPVDNSNQITLNKFASYENFISENESKLKANLVNASLYNFNTKRKKYISEKTIQTLVKLIVDSRHQQQMRQYSNPNQIPGPAPQGNPQYMPLPPHYAQKIPMNHPINPEQQSAPPIPNGPQNYQMHPQMSSQHMGSSNMHLMNMRNPPDPPFQGPPNTRAYNYMGGPPNNRAPMMNPNSSRPSGPTGHPPTHPGMNPNNMPPAGGMQMTRESSRNNINLRYVNGPNMTGVTINNHNAGINNMPQQGINRSNVYQLQINSVNNIKNEQLKMVKKPKN